MLIRHAITICIVSRVLPVTSCSFLVSLFCLSMFWTVIWIFSFHYFRIRELRFRCGASFVFIYRVQSYYLFSHGMTARGHRPPHYQVFTITLRHITLGRTPLDDWSARRRHRYLTKHNTHKRQTSIPAAGFEPAIPASERPQTLSLDRTATGIGNTRLCRGINSSWLCSHHGNRCVEYLFLKNCSFVFTVYLSAPVHLVEY